MDPIPPVNIGSAGRSSHPTLDLNQVGGATRTGATPGMAGFSSQAVGDSTALRQIDAAVSQLVQSLGGSAADEKILRMLIGLIILLALLRGSQDEPASAQNALASLAGGSNSSQFVALYASSTTISIEQTTTTIVLGTADTYAAASNGDSGQAGGGQMDVFA